MSEKWTNACTLKLIRQTNKNKKWTAKFLVCLFVFYFAWHGLSCLHYNFTLKGGTYFSTSRSNSVTGWGWRTIKGSGKKPVT